MIIITNYLCHHYYYWQVCWLWLGPLALRPSVLSFFTECDIFFYYKARQELLHSATAFSLQCTTRVITKCDSFFLTKYDVCYYKVWQLFLLQVATLFHYKVAKRCYDKVQQVLQSATAFYQKVATILLQSVTGIAKCDRYYKVLRIFQSTTEQLATFTTHYFN